MSYRFFTLAACSLFAPLSLFAESAPFLIVEKERVLPAVEVANPKASSTLAYAEEELRRVLSLIAKGADDDSSGKGTIRLARYADLPEAVRAAYPLKGESEDEVLIVREGDMLYLSGPTDRAVLYAVYTFLQEVVGVRWLWPGDDGERIPKVADLKMEKPVIQHRPTLSYRSLSLTGTNEHDEPNRVWAARNRLNIGVLTPWMKGISVDDALAFNRKLGFYNRWAGHSVVLPSDVLKQHPEYVAEYSGVRQGFNSHQAHLCWSNPEVQEALCKSQQELVLRYPDLDIISLYTTDHGQYCQCAACVEMAPDISTRWQLLSEKLVAAIKEVRPEMKVWTLAYDRYRPVPNTVAAYDNIEYTIYNASYRFPYTSGAASNATALREMKGWQGKGAKMGIRNYEMIPFRGPGGYVPLVYFMSDQIRYAKENHLDSYNSEITPLGWPRGAAPETQRWNSNRINAYALAQFAWNGKRTPEELVGEWCRAAYGPAAQPMQRYYEAMEKAWRKAPGDISGFHRTGALFMPGYITEGLINTVTPLFVEAQKLASEANDTEAMAQVELDARMFSEWQDLFFYAQLPATADNFRALPEGDAGEAASHRLANGESVAFQWTPETLHITWSGALDDGGQRTLRFLHPTEIGTAVELAMDLGEQTISARRSSLSGAEEPLSEGRVKLDARPGAWKVSIPREEIPSASAGEEWQRLILLTGKGEKTQRLWPENPLRANGKLYFLPRALPRVSFLERRAAAPNPPHLILSALGWESRRTLSIEAADTDLLVIRSGEGRERIRPEQVSRSLKAFLEAGGAAIVTFDDSVPLHQWLDDAGLALGWVQEPLVRRTATDIDSGDWALQPHRLFDWIRTGTTPIHGLRPSKPERWQALASLPMKNGESLPFLLRTRVGRGTLYVTTERIGYGGGFTTFGDRNTLRIAPLIENLWQDHLSQSQQSAVATGARD